jgi:hypothetical protein
MEDDQTAIGDVYAHLVDSPTWTDSRTDGPPYLLSANDILAWNAFVSDTVTAMRNNANLAVALKGCVQPVG